MLTLIRYYISVYYNNWFLRQYRIQNCETYLRIEREGDRGSLSMAVFVDSS
jgi:hypothetical protein